MSKPRVEAVLFDLDGTLLDTLQDLADCMNAVLVENGFEPAPIERHKFMIGDGTQTYLRRALPEERKDDEVLAEKMITRFRKLYANGWTNTTQPYPGVVEMLRGVADAGVIMTILSNKIDCSTREAVAHFFAEFDFAIIRGAIEGVPIKPNPVGPLQVAGEVGVAPDRFLYLGDTNTDMQCARAAGMHAVGACWGFRPRGELIDAGAKTLIERPEQFLELLG